MREGNVAWKFVRITDRGGSNGQKKLDKLLKKYMLLYTMIYINIYNYNIINM